MAKHRAKGLKKKLGRRYCVYCKKKLNDETVTVDHFVPLSRGGTNSEDNIVPSCFDCNHTKADIVFDSIKEVRKYLDDPTSRTLMRIVLFRLKGSNS